MKIRKHIFAFVLYIVILISLIITFTYIENSDLNGRMIVNKVYPQNTMDKLPINSTPVITLTLHKYLAEENSIEASLFLNYRRDIFDNYKQDTLRFVTKLTDGYSYTPSGFTNTFYFNDSNRRQMHGYINSAFESERFSIPIAPSLYGYPFDDLQIRPLVQLFINGNRSEVYLNVQKRIPGRVFSSYKKDKDVVSLTRVPTYKWLVIVISFIFLCIASILTISILKSENGLRKTEEIIAVAGYILATTGIKEILGFEKNNGPGLLEVLVILLPIVLLSASLIYSLFRSQQRKN